MNGPKKRTNPLVSIIVITYNSVKYVLETLESAKAQTYRNVELIVSDDCSTDDTVAVCRKWLDENGGHFVRAELLQTPRNTGCPGNCNRGLRVAQGVWIKFIAGDDILLPDCLEAMLEFAIAKNVRIATSAMEEFCDDGWPTRISKRLRADQARFFRTSKERQLEVYLRYPIFLNTPAFLINKNVFSKIGMYDEAFGMLEDTPFVIKALQAGYTVCYNERTTVRYRTAPPAKMRVDRQSDDMFLCFDRYQRPFLHKHTIANWFVFYHWYLRNRSWKAKTWPRKLLFRVLIMFTDMIALRNRLPYVRSMGASMASH
jgi:glycosyltransferase involved in cell wall biosynthesis